MLSRLALFPDDAPSGARGSCAAAPCGWPALLSVSGTTRAAPAQTLCAPARGSPGTKGNQGFGDPERALHDASGRGRGAGLAGRAGSPPAGRTGHCKGPVLPGSPAGPPTCLSPSGSGFGGFLRSKNMNFHLKQNKTFSSLPFLARFLSILPVCVLHVAKSSPRLWSFGFAPNGSARGK